MQEEFIFYGDDYRIERFPEGTRFFYPNPPLEPVPDPSGAIEHALDHPLDAVPLEKQLDARSRVTIAFDDPCVPVPLTRHDPRGPIIESLLTRLNKIGVPKENIRLVCANGLHRKWTLKELTAILGSKVVNEMKERISCHDGTLDGELIHLGETEDAMEVEINRAVADSDLTIYVNQNFASMNGGWKSIAVGLGSWRSIRHHHNPSVWKGEESLMDPGTSPMHRALEKMGRMIKERYNVFTIETVTNNHFWPPPLDKALAHLRSESRATPPGRLMRAALNLAARMPRHVKETVRGGLKTNCMVTAVHAGDVDAVHSRTLEVLLKQQNVKVDGQVDVLVLGVPNLMPYSAFSIMNPILLRSMTLGYYMGMFRNRPLVKRDGVIVAYNPGLERFHAQHHPSYVDFWNKDLEAFRDPEACWSELAESYAENPEYLEKYRDHYAYHGSHSLMNWFWSGMALRYLKGVVLAGAREPGTARKLGFHPRPDFSSALDLAREMAGRDAVFGFMAMPPHFVVEVP